MWEMWTSLTVEQQAVVIGGLVSVLFYLGRWVWPPAFEDATSVAKWQRTATAFVLCVATAAANSIAQGQAITLAVVISWLLAYATSEAAHTLVSRTTALR